MGATLPLLLALLYAFAFVNNTSDSPSSTVTGDHIGCKPELHLCVMKTMFGLEEGPARLKTIDALELSKDVRASITGGLQWVAKAQLPDGGWGAGFHSMQDIRDPLAVKADPATTSLVLLSLLRTGNSLPSL